MHFLLSLNFNGAKMKKIILLLMSSILSACEISYNYVQIYENISHIGKTTIPYKNIKAGSYVLVGKEYVFIINPSTDKKFIVENNKIEQFFQTIISKNKTFIMKSGIWYSNKDRTGYSDDDQEKNELHHNYLCVVDTIPHEQEFYKNFEDEENCTVIPEAYYYKIDANMLNEINKMNKLTIPAKIRIVTNKKSGVDVGDTMLRIPLTVFGLAAMVGAK